MTALVLAWSPSPAGADGDPASDFLVTQQVFFPFHAPRPRLKWELLALTKAAKRDGFPIRVAVIQARSDLGAVSVLYGKPKTYARWLGVELRRVYKNPLLVVMHQGFGYSRAGHPIPGSAQTVASLPLPSGNSPDQLTQAAITAVRGLASAGGHRLPPLAPATGTILSSSPEPFVYRNGPTIVAVLGILAGVCFAALIFVTGRGQR